MEIEKTEENLGRKQSEATKRKISRAMSGDGNSQWKDGRREDYRKKMGLKKGDPRIVHHKNNQHNDNSKSNLRVVSRKRHEGPIHHRGNNFRR
jgi:hypothetical protein